jgi:pimeloyl-ACP methyl ester carboxylesterase
MAWFEHGDMRIYYEETGSGDPVLLLPGWGGSIDEHAPLREALAPTYRVIAADVPGSGKSGPQPRTYPPSYYRDDALVFLDMSDALGASPARLVGFSDGGEYALLMAAMRPEAVRSVVTWGSAGALPEAPELTEAFSSLVDDPIPPLADFSAYMKAAYGEQNARVMAQSVAASLRTIMDAGGDISRSRAASITCPALLITGAHDFLATPELVAEMAQAIPNGEFVEAKDASHAVHHEQPGWLSETVVRWLSKH